MHETEKRHRCVTVYLFSFPFDLPPFLTPSLTRSLGQSVTHCTSGNRTAISPDCVIYRTHGREGYCNYITTRVSQVNTGLPDIEQTTTK